MRYAVVDDSEFTLAAFRGPLERYGHQLVLAVTSGAELLARIDEVDPPDLVVLDKAIPPNRLEGFETAQALRARFPGIGIMLISFEMEVEDVQRAQRLGGDGVGLVQKKSIARISAFAAVLDGVANGGSYVDPDLRRQVAARAEREGALDALSAREAEVLDLAAQGLSNQQIADRLRRPDGGALSDRTVEGYLKNAYQKLGVDIHNGRVLASVLWATSGRRPPV
ncbi:LuxR C-terminal-related transcriptional regulator [Quadrisphaera oryzae]|uniref:LuxR C-terminal-related transcriptional regulator n=1 Tax=Quadrisphaera TaxID=317661 RepID=UPI001646C4CA